MICKIQVVTIGEDGRNETREITSIQRTDVKPETLGLTLAEGKMILKDLQQIVVESRCRAYCCQSGLVLIAASRVAAKVITRSPFAPSSASSW
jgi:hypothetical protein